MTIPQKDLHQAGALAFVSKFARYLPTAVDLFAVANHLAVLSAIHDKRLEEGRPGLREPLIWLALARAAGLEVSDQGQIIGGPVLPTTEEV